MVQLHECKPLKQESCHPGGELLGMGPEAGYDRAWGGGQAGEGPAAEVAVAPVTLALVDAGGGEEWLELVRGALAAALEALPPTALFGLVTFGTNVRTRAHTGPCVSAHRLGGSCAAPMCLPKLIVAPVFGERLWPHCIQNTCARLCGDVSLCTPTMQRGNPLYDACVACRFIPGCA